MREIFTTFFLICACFKSAVSQETKLISDCTIYYKVTVEDAKADLQVVQSMENTTRIVYIKGSKSRSDLITSGFKQTTLFNTKSDSIVLLRELGDTKYISYLNSSKRSEQNKKYEGIQFTSTNETKTILGYDCKKVIAKLKDGSAYSVYFTPSVTVSNKEFEYQFKDLAGFVLEYEAEIANEKIKVKYTASKITFEPVPIAVFDVPNNGYRIL